MKDDVLEVSINSISEIQQEAEISLSPEELLPHFEKAYTQLQPKIEIKGFRKGKVPLGMIKKIYGEAIEHDTLDQLANDYYHQAMTEKNISPIGQPSMVDMDFKRGEHFRFKIKYEVRPVIELKQYKGIAVPRPVHTVADAELEGELQHMLRLNSVTAPAERVTDKNYIVTADVQELDEAGTPIIGKKTKDARFFLTDETLAPEIKKALSSAEPGQEYRTQFESKHEDHSHTVHLLLKVTKVEHVATPEFNDEFVKKITKDQVTNAQEFKKSMRDDLERFWTEQGEKKVSEAIVSELVRMHEFPVPESLVNGLLDSYVEDIKNKSRDKKLPKGFDEAKFREESNAMAVFQGKWMLLKNRIAEEEGITITDDDISSAAEQEAARIGLPKERLLEYYKSSSVVSDRLLSDRLMMFLKSNAIVTDQPEETKA